MSEVLKAIQDRITAIDWKISSNDNVRDHVEELNFLKELLGKFMVYGSGQSNTMDVGAIVDVLGAYARETPVFAYNCTPGTDALYRFSRLQSFLYNPEKGAIELYYNEGDENSYEDY